MLLQMSELILLQARASLQAQDRLETGLHLSKARASLQAHDRLALRLGFASLTNHIYQPSSDDAGFRMRKCLARCTSRPNPCDAAGQESFATCTSVGARKCRYIRTSKSSNWLRQTEVSLNRYINRLFEPSSHADGSCRMRLWV